MFRDRPRGQTLDGGEDVLKEFGTVASDPLLTESRVAEGETESRPALVNDLLAMRDKEKAATG